MAIFALAFETAAFALKPKFSVAATDIAALPVLFLSFYSFQTHNLLFKLFRSLELDGRLMRV